MKNLKIRVNNEAESREVQGLFFELGCTWSGDSKDIFDFDMPDYIVNWNNGYITVGDDFDKNRQEITLPQLRDLVVLKRNKNTDATHIDSNNYDWYVASDEKHYRHQGDIWVYQPYVDCLDLKPIEKPMKEYLNPKRNYELCLSDEDLTKEGMIKIPEKWMNFVYKLPDGDIRFSDNLVSTIADHIIWQRHTHPEELPFIDDEPKPSLNDTYAEIEKVRQSHRTASEIADSALKHIRERAETYDQPTGERSAAKTAKAFNAITGKDITESEVWLLLQLLKDVRQWSREDYHQDSAEDCIAYAALKAESLEGEE